MTQHIIAHVEGHIGRIRLNRPERLNALNTAMCGAVSEAVKSWSNDPNIVAILIDHEPSARGFCAGGDIDMMAQSGRGDGKDGEAFFRTEYTLNTLLHAYAKPIISFMDGVVMGGGVGLSVHGSHRIVTENTVFAMPEVSIGFVPDVGSSWFLPRLPHNIGIWLGLTGARLKGVACCPCGIATHFVPQRQLAALKLDLIGAKSAINVNQRLGAYKVGTDSASAAVPDYWAHRADISQAFAFPQARDVIGYLQNTPSEWLQQQAKDILSKSPESVELTINLLQNGARAERFEDAISHEFRVACRRIKSQDFQEGVRAVILEKDHTPIWSPSTLSGVDAGHLASYFQPMETELFG